MPQHRPIKRTLSRLSMPLRRRLGVALPPREFLMRSLPRDSVGAEIGVWRGEFSADILRRVRPRRLHLIDPWAFMPERARSVYGGSVAKEQADMDAIHEAVAQRFAAEIRSGTVVMHRATSADAALTFDDEYFDWVYIDGDHSYEAVLADLRAFTPKVKRGGLVTGDDYGRKGWWGPGVAKAVDEHVADGACSLEWIRGKQFALRRP
ncbi:MAG: class I SAM-dependent methyltransferase [Acidimicrobiia bacterium]